MTALARLRSMHEVEIHDWLGKVELAGVHPLIIALLGADEEARNCIYRNMSASAVDFLKKELEKYRKMAFSEEDIRENDVKMKEFF